MQDRGAPGWQFTGIGRAEACRIRYKALPTCFASSTGHAVTRSGAPPAASDLYGAGSAEDQAVAAAWTAVNVNWPSPPRGCRIVLTGGPASPPHTASSPRCR